MGGTTRVGGDDLCSCIPFVDESSSSSSSSQVQLSRQNFRKGNVQILSIVMSSYTDTESDSDFFSLLEAQTLGRHTNHRQQQHSVLMQVEACSSCFGGCADTKYGHRDMTQDYDILCRILSNLFGKNQLGECQLKLLIDSRTVVVRGVLVPCGSHRGMLITEPFTDISKHMNDPSPPSIPASFFCSACGSSNTPTSSSPSVGQGAFSSWPSSVDSNMDSLNEDTQQGLKKRRKDGNGQGQANGSSSSGSSRRGEQLLQAAGRQLGGKDGQRAESKKVDRNEKVQNSLKMRLNETKSAHQMNNDFLVSPDDKDVFRNKSTFLSTSHSSVSSSSSMVGSSMQSPSEFSAATTPATIGSNNDYIHHLVATSSGGSSNWDDTCSPGETPCRSSPAPPYVDANNGIAYSLGYSKSGFEHTENSMYLGHDYTYDEFGSRSIFTELHDGEVPVPYEQTGNMCVISTSHSTLPPTSSASSSAPHIGTGNGIFQTVMQGYHSNSLYSSNSGNTGSMDEDTDLAGSGRDNIEQCPSTENVPDEGKPEEFIDHFRRLCGRNIREYLSSKNIDQAVSALDPYNVDHMVDLCNNIRDYLIEELLRPVKEPPIEVAFKMSSMVYSYVYPLVEFTSPSTTSKSVYKKHMSFIVDTMQMISVVLNEIVFMKLKLTFPISLEMSHRVVLAASVIQITFQMELMRHVHVALELIAKCDSRVSGTRKGKTAGIEKRKKCNNYEDKKGKLLRKITRSSERYVDSTITKLRLQLESSTSSNAKHEEDTLTLCHCDLKRIISFFIDVSDSEAGTETYSRSESLQPFKPSRSTSPSRSPGDSDFNQEGKYVLSQVSNAYRRLQSLTGSKIIANCFSLANFDPNAYLNKILMRHFEDYKDNFGSSEKENPSKMAVPNAISTKPVAPCTFSFYAEVERTASRSNLFEIDVNNKEMPVTDLQDAMKDDEKVTNTDLLAKHHVSRSRAPLDIIPLNTGKADAPIPSMSSSSSIVSTGSAGTSTIPTSSNSLLRRQSTLMVGHRAAMAGRLNKTKSINLSVVPEKKNQPASFNASKGFLKRGGSVGNHIGEEIDSNYGRSLKRSVSEVYSRPVSSSSHASKSSRGALLMRESNKRVMHLDKSGRQKNGGKDSRALSKQTESGSNNDSKYLKSKSTLRRIASVQETPIHLRAPQPRRVAAVEETPVGKLKL